MWCWHWFCIGWKLARRAGIWHTLERMVAWDTRSRDTRPGHGEKEGRHGRCREVTFHLVISHGDKEQEGTCGLEVKDQSSKTQRPQRKMAESRLSWWSKERLHTMFLALPYTLGSCLRTPIYWYTHCGVSVYVCVHTPQHVCASQRTARGINSSTTWAPGIKLSHRLRSGHLTAQPSYSWDEDFRWAWSSPIRWVCWPASLGVCPSLTPTLSYKAFYVSAKYQTTGPQRLFAQQAICPLSHFTTLRTFNVLLENSNEKTIFRYEML